MRRHPLFSWVACHGCSARASMRAGSSGIALAKRRGHSEVGGAEACRALVATWRVQSGQVKRRWFAYPLRQPRVIGEVVVGERVHQCPETRGPDEAQHLWQQVLAEVDLPIGLPPGRTPREGGASGAGSASFLASVFAAGAPAKEAPLAVSPAVENLAAWPSPTPLTVSSSAWVYLLAGWPWRHGVSPYRAPCGRR